MIGKTVWFFDENYRTYVTDANGRSRGGPIYREHWRPVVITGETSRSWVTDYYGKIPKKGPRVGWALTQKEVDDDCWVHSYRGHVANALHTCRNADVIREVARVLGYTPPALLE